jgi:Zn-dependent alcohol dehydrogenase
MEAARSFGASHTVNATRDDAVEAVKELTHGRGVDYVFVTAAGSNAAIQQGLAMAGQRGTIVLVGLPEGGIVSLSFPAYDFIHAEKIITGGSMGSTHLKVDIPHYVELYQAGLIKLDELISGRYQLEQINEAIDSVLRGEALRNVIMFQ